MDTLGFCCGVYHRIKNKNFIVSKIDFLSKHVYVLDNSGNELKRPFPFCDVIFDFRFRGTLDGN